MNIIGITGASGMIGWHLRTFLETKGVSEIKIATRETFKSNEALIDFVKNTDVIFHLASQCSGDDLLEVNNQIDKSLVAAIDQVSATPHIIFASSSHIKINQSSQFALSKLTSSKYFERWSIKRGIRFSNIVIPHVFGENGRPFHNSVVTTFSHQLANGKKIKLLVDKQLELIHAQKLSESIYEIALKSTIGEIKIPGFLLKVSQLMKRLILFDKKYRDHVIPLFENDLDLYLFNTYRSYFPNSYYPVHFEEHSDYRGSLYEVTKTMNGSQCFVSTTKPGVIRGNHYHKEKIERFIVLKGNAKVSIRKKHHNDTVEYLVNGDIPSYIDIPTLHTHNIENIGDSEMLVLFWAHQLYDPNEPDTYYEEV